MRRPAVAALALATTLAGCGGGAGGPDAAPATTGAQPTTTAQATKRPSLAPVPPEVRKIADATAATRKACPCAVEMILTSSNGGKANRLTLTGVYDAAKRTTELRLTEAKDIVVRVVEGRTFAFVDGTWMELDYASMPRETTSPFAPFALADAGIGFALAATVTVATPTAMPIGGESFDVAYDVRAAAKAAGPSGPLLRRLVPSGHAYDMVVVGKNGRLHNLHFQTNLPDGEPSLSMRLEIKKTGVAAPAVTVPKKVAGKVDGATFS